MKKHVVAGIIGLVLLFLGMLLYVMSVVDYQYAVSQWFSTVGFVCILVGLALYFIVFGSILMRRLSS